MQRRTFVIVAAAAGAAVGVGLVIRKVGWGDRSLDLDLAALLTDAPHARVIGRLYLEREPGENDQQRLAGLVFPDLESAEAPPRRDAVLEAFFRRVRSEFEEHDTVQVDGWILSRTEARLCALTTFL